jgi:predicted PurR-regulated permease PerM
VILVILIPLSLVTAAVINEAKNLANQIQQFQSGGFHPLDPNSPYTGRLVRWIEQYVSLDSFRQQDAISDRLNSIMGSIASRTIGVVGGVIGAVVQIFFIIFTMYYLFRDGDRILRALKDWLPLERSQSEQIFERTRDVIGASVYGVLIIAVVQGTLGGLAFWTLGIHSPLLWGVVMTFASMIPVAGAFVVWVPAAIYLALTGSYVKAALLTAWGALVIGSIDNFLRPKLVGEKTRLHELLIFFSVLGGLQVFGVLGLVLGPVIVAITLALIDIYRQAENPADESADEPSVVEEQASIRTTDD